MMAADERWSRFLKIAQCLSDGLLEEKGRLKPSQVDALNVSKHSSAVFSSGIFRQ